MFTQYLSKQDPDGWGKSPGFGTTVDFPAVPGALGENGTGGMVTGCADDPGLRRLHRHQLPRPGHPEGAGRGPIGQCLRQFPAARRPKRPGRGRQLRLSDPGEPGDLADQRARPDGYPIVNYEYAIVYSRQKDAATAQTMQAFLHWAVTEGNSGSFLDQVHFQPLPAAVAKLSDAQIAKISS